MAGINEGATKNGGFLLGFSVNNSVFVHSLFSFGFWGFALARQSRTLTG
jgi:hypothetical protein